MDECGKSRLPPGFEPQTVQPAASRYPTTLSRRHFKMKTFPKRLYISTVIRTYTYRIFSLLPWRMHLHIPNIFIPTLKNAPTYTGYFHYYLKHVPPYNGHFHPYPEERTSVYWTFSLLPRRTYLHIPDIFTAILKNAPPYNGNFHFYPEERTYTYRTCSLLPWRRPQQDRTVAALFSITTATGITVRTGTADVKRHKRFRCETKRTYTVEPLTTDTDGEFKFCPL
jgi:hypothetical protein